MNIIQNYTAENFCSKFWNCYEDTFIEGAQIKVHRYAGSVNLCDITHAMQPGKACETISIQWWPHTEIPGAAIDPLFSAHGYDVRAVFNALRALPWQYRKHWKTGAMTSEWQELTGPALADALPGFESSEKMPQLSIHRGERKAIRVFSPFAKVKPLPAKPAKWTVAHVVRALMAGQFSSLKCNGVYSDDYAYDAAVNFHQGEIKNAVAFARRIMENPSGWWAHEDSDSVSICCHHFDSNEFVFKL